MKNKKLQYILVPLVILIWGLVFFKVIDHIREKNDADFAKSVSVKNIKKESVSDTFSIRADYRDPFKKYIVSAKSSSQESVIPKRIKQEVNPAFIQWPDVSYGGLILNEKGKYKTALLKINNQDFLLKTGDSRNGIKIEAVFADSIKLSYSKQIKIFYKQRSI